MLTERETTNWENVQIATPRGAIPAVLHHPRPSLLQGVPSRPVVVCCHGMLSSMQSSKFVGAADRLAENGLLALRFDFTGCGENRSAPAESLLATRQNDLEEVLHWVEKLGCAGPVGLFGSSLGGFLSLLLASRFSERVRAVVTWAAPYDLTELFPGVPASRPSSPAWPSGLPLGEPTVVQESPDLTHVLVVHGMGDEIVPWSHAVNIYRKVGEPKRLLLLEEGDHRFVDNTVRNRLLDVTVDWFRKWLLPQEAGCA